MDKLKITHPDIENYCVAHSTAPIKPCEDIHQFTKENVHGAQMVSGKLVGSFVGFLLRSIKAKRVLEFGTFTGYSALNMASHLPDDGEVVTLEFSKDVLDVAQNFWKQSPEHGKKIISHLGPALETVKNVTGKFDFIFIDADKANYLNYFKIAMEKINENGIIVIDNTLWDGEVLQNPGKDHSTRSIQQLNDFISQNENLYHTLCPIRDGLHLVHCLKK